MLKKVVVLLFLLLSSVFAEETVKDKLYNDINKEFKTDFSAWESKFFKESLMIRFSKNNILYNRGQSNMHRSFQIILMDFSPRFVDILSKYKDQIASVTIKGHTSSENRAGKTIEEKFEKNLQLSQKRADSVLSFIKNINDPKIKNNIDWLNSVFFAEGLSSLEPIFYRSGKENKEASRRTEIIITLKDPQLKASFIKEDKEEKTSKVIEKTLNKKDPVVVEDQEGKKVLKLEKYVKRILSENPTLTEQYYLVQSFKKDIEKAKGNFRPTVTVNFSHKEYDEYKPTNKTKEQSKDITVKYNLFNGFKDTEEENIAKHMYQSSVYAKEQIENELIYSVAEAYLTLQRANEVYELSKKNYESYVAWEEKSKIKFQNGLLSLKDYSKIQARSISRYMNFEEDTKRYIDGITTMQRYLDFSDKEIEYFETPNIESEYFNNVKLSLSQSKLSSPFIKEANENIKLYKSQMEQAKVNFYPTIDLIALKSKQDETFESTSETETEETSLELKASLELYSGGKEQAEYDSKLMEYRQKIQKKEAVIKDVIYKVDLALNQMNLLSIKESFFNDLINKREEENVAANYDFKFGKIDENDLLDIVDSLYNAKRQYVENKYDLMIAKYKLLEQIGVVKQSILED